MLGAQGFALEESKSVFAALHCKLVARSVVALLRREGRRDRERREELRLQRDIL